MKHYILPIILACFLPALFAQNAPTLHFTAESLASTLKDGDPVTSWQSVEKSTLDAKLVSGKRNFPLFKTKVLNGYPVIRFADSQEYLASPAITPTGKEGFTIIVVCRPEKAISLLATHQRGFDGAAWTLRGTQFNGQPNSGGKTIQELKANVPSKNREPLNNKWLCISAVAKNGDINKLYANGRVIAQSKEKLSGFTPAKGPFVVGNAPVIMDNAPDVALKGDIAELLVFDRPLSDKERGVLEKQLIKKYKIPTR